MKKYDLFDLLKSLENRSETLREIFEDSYFLDHEISMVWGLIEDKYGIKDTPKNLGRSDESMGILNAFGCGDITKEQAIKKLKRIK